VHQLSQLYNRRQRIQIIVIMLGQAGNFPMLQQVAAATHGKAYQVTQPGQVGSTFLSRVRAAHLRRTVEYRR
jgi:hypothetical protein